LLTEGLAVCFAYARFEKPPTKNTTINPPSLNSLPPPDSIEFFFRIGNHTAKSPENAL
jgi:hypothetical protein